MLFGTNQRKPMGLFGGFAPSGMQQMPQADPMAAMGQSMGQAPMMQQGQQFAQSQAPKKPGINWLGVLADTLAGAAGREGPYAASMRARQEQEAAQEHARQQREASMQDWRTKFEYENEYERNNPKPINNDTINDFNWYKGLSAEDRALYDQQNPVVIQGPDGPYVVPRSAIGGNKPIGGAVPQSDWDSAQPIGGASGNVGGGFPVNANSLDRITVQAESAGNPNAVSPKGARGLWQVMPATARKPGFGITPSNGTQADDARVGAEYRRKMEARYGGDPAKMWAAYNWGPGNLDNALEKYGNNWLQYAPAETRNYVTRNMRALKGGR